MGPNGSEQSNTHKGLEDPIRSLDGPNKNIIQETPGAIGSMPGNMGKSKRFYYCYYYNFYYYSYYCYYYYW